MGVGERGWGWGGGGGVGGDLRGSEEEGEEEKGHHLVEFLDILQIYLSLLHQTSLRRVQILCTHTHTQNTVKVKTLILLQAILPQSHSQARLPTVGILLM